MALTPSADRVAHAELGRVLGGPAARVVSGRGGEAVRGRAITSDAGADRYGDRRSAAARAVEVYSAPRSSGYASQRTAALGEVLRAIAVPELELAITELIPPAA